MADSAALLVDDVLPHEPMRQWVLSVPFPLRFLIASQPAVMGKVAGFSLHAGVATRAHVPTFTDNYLPAVNSLTKSGTGLL